MSGDTTRLLTRMRFRECCGPNGFFPNEWFHCTGCKKVGGFGENVPYNYHLICFVRGKQSHLLCNTCYEELDPVWRP